MVSGTARDVIGQGRETTRWLWQACLSRDLELELPRRTLVSHADGLFGAAVLGSSAYG